MAYPGLTFLVAVGVATCAAIYYYFSKDNGNRNHQYQYADNSDDTNVNPWTPSQNARMRNRSYRNRRCSICLDMIEIEKILEISCGHVYHRNCITRWVNDQKNNTCPLCRHTIVHPI